MANVEASLCAISLITSVGTNLHLFRRVAWQQFNWPFSILLQPGVLHHTSKSGVADGTRVLREQLTHIVGHLQVGVI